MKPLNNKGIALVTALMLTLISLIIILGVLSMLTESTKVSAAQKRYRNVVEASYGGAEVMAQDILPQICTIVATGGTLNAATLTNLSNSFTAPLALGFSTSACLNQKLWSVPGSWSSCSQINLDPTKSPDATFTLSGTSGLKYTVYAKIVDTIPGVPYQSSSNEQLLGSGVAESSTGTTMTLPHFVYRFEVMSVRSTNAAEKSVLSVLYEY